MGAKAPFQSTVRFAGGLLGLFLFACGDTSNVEDVSFETIMKGEYSGIREERMEVIRDPDTWGAFWLKFDNFTSRPVSVPPDVDFETEMVIVVHVGERSFEGDSVEVLRVENGENRLRVGYVETQPSGLCPVAAVVITTYPFHIIRLERVDKDAVFSGRLTVSEDVC